MEKEAAKKVMAIGAHPDDVEFAMGGTLAMFHKRGFETMILDITNGEPTPFGSVEKRMEESKRAASILGASRVTLDESNRKLFDSVEARQKIGEQIRLFQPDIIFSHYPLDAHPDHWAASDLAMASRFYGKLTHTEMKGERHYTPRIFYFFAVHLRISPTPTFTLDITPYMETKLEALLSYESQFHELRGKKMVNREEKIKHFVKTHNGYWGQNSGAAYAEPFYSPEIFALKDLDSLLIKV